MLVDMELDPKVSIFPLPCLQEVRNEAYFGLRNASLLKKRLLYGFPKSDDYWLAALSLEQHAKE